MTTNGTKVSNGIVSNNPDFFTRADPDIDSRLRQVVRLDLTTGVGESLLSAANPLPVAATIAGTPTVNLTRLGGELIQTAGDLDFAASRGIAALGTDGTSMRVLLTDDTGVLITSVTAQPAYQFSKTVQLSGLNAENFIFCVGTSSATVMISGTYSGTFAFEASVNESVYIAVAATRLSNNTTETSTGALVNVTRVWTLATAGYTNFRIRCSAYTSGSASTVVNITTSAPSVTKLESTQAYPFATEETAEGIHGQITKTGRWNGSDWAAWGGGVTGIVALRPDRESGSIGYRNLDLGNTGVSLKGSNGTLYSVMAFNSTGATFYVKFYNKATAPSNADTTHQVYAVGAGSTLVYAPANGIIFPIGIGVRCVTGVADASAVSPAANGCVFNCTCF